MTPEFWSLIDSTRPDTWHPKGHAEAITEALFESGTEAALWFAAAFDEALDRLYTWDLWGAAYLAFGGCSDDAFEYLRSWVIGAGESFWEKALTDPEGLFVDLLAGVDDPDSRWAELRIHEGEPLLYTGGAAHQRLTGEWPPNRSHPHPSEPSGDQWEEDDLPGLYPDLFAALPEAWWAGEQEVSDDGPRVMIQVERGVDAFSQGDHAGAGRLLDEIVDDPAQWSQVLDERRVDVAYVVGVGRLLSGDVDGAANALLLVEPRLPEAQHVRRALAQVELARGDLENASRWIDVNEEASRLDRVLAAKLLASWGS